jgi:hypothetical protein
MKLQKVVSMWRARALRLPMKWFSSASQALRAVWPRCRVMSVVVDAEVTLNEAPEGGVHVEGVSFAVAKEVVL